MPGTHVSGVRGVSLLLMSWAAPASARPYARRYNDLIQAKVDPRLDNLPSSPRFQDLLRRLNFPEQ